ELRHIEGHRHRSNSKNGQAARRALLPLGDRVRPQCASLRVRCHAEIAPDNANSGLIGIVNLHKADGSLRLLLPALKPLDARFGETLLFLWGVKSVIGYA